MEQQPAPTDGTPHDWRRRERLFLRTLEALPVGVLRMGLDGRVHEVNARFGALLRTPEGTPSTAGLAERLAGCGPEDAARVQVAVRTCLAAGSEGRVQVTVGADGWTDGQHCALDITPLGDEDGDPGVLLVVQDVTDSVRAQRRLTEQATTDALTGCLNRAGAPPGSSSSTSTGSRQ